MSDWGLISLYYDYEHEDKIPGTKDVQVLNIQGLVSKAYSYPGIDGMIYHAYNGVKYFWDRINAKSCWDFSLSKHINDKRNGVILPGAWYELNTAFDVYFDYAYIDPGVDSVSYVLDNWDTHPEYHSSDKNLKNHLFNCEGTYGWFFIKCTGNQRDGYKLRYAYNYDCRPDSVRNIVEVYNKRLEKDGIKPEDEDTYDSLKEAIEFFEENAFLITSTNEFWDFETEPAALIRRCMDAGSDDQ